MKSQLCSILMYFSIVFSLLLVGCSDGGNSPSSINASLSNLQVVGVSLDQIFQYNQLSYTADVGFLGASIRVIASSTDSGASFTVNGAPASTGVATDAIALNEGSNIIDVVVTAEDGVTTQAYTIDVTRQLAVSFAQQAYIKASNTGWGDSFGYSVALASDTLVVGAYSEDSNANGSNGDELDNSAVDAGAAYVFTRSGGTWTQQAYLKASNPGGSDHFGIRVALSGDTLAVGAHLEDSNAIGVNGDELDNSASNAGAVYVFTRSGGIWTQQAYLKASNTGAGDSFGVSVALVGDTLAVGTYLEGSAANGVNGDELDNSASGAGAVYVFTRSGGSWIQQAYLKASNSEVGDSFGYSVALAGDTLAVGAYSEDSNATGVGGEEFDNSANDAGAVYVFSRAGSTWTQQAYIKPSNTDAYDNFGRNIALSDDTLAAGALAEDSYANGVNGDELNDSASNAGAVYVFTRNGGTWIQQLYLKASNPDANDNFGIRLTLDGDTLAVGALQEDSNATGVDGNQADNSIFEAGSVYVFQ